MLTLVTIAPGHQLAPAAAAAYLRARSAGCPAGITSSTRSLAQQAALYAAWRAGRMPGTSSVAVPGTSRHERGTALDLPEPARTWMRQHGHDYGWVSGIVPGEPWHMEYRATTDQHLTDPVTATPVAPATTKENEDMARLVKHPNGTVAVVGPGTQMTVLKTMDEVDALRSTGQVTGDLIVTPDPLIWETCKTVAQRSGTYKD